MGKLSATAVKAASRPGKIGDGDGLYLVVKRSGSKSWMVRVQPETARRVRQRIGTVKYWSKLDDRLMREYGVTKALRTPVNFIVHTLQEVNDRLAHGRYFFMDVKQDGIALYQSDDTELHTPKPKARILILDEATSALDAESEEIIQKNLARIAKGRTVLIIAHQLSAVRPCNRNITVEAGEITEIGSHEELLRAGGRYAQLHAKQIGYRGDPETMQA